MDMNLAELSFEKTEHCVPMYFRHSDHDRRDVFYMLDDEIPDILRILRGEAKYYPCFEDGIYLMQFRPNGARYIQLNHYCMKGSNVKSDGEYEERWYNFDGGWLARHIEKAARLEKGEKYDVEYTEFSKERWRLRPIVEWSFGDGVKEAIEQDKNNKKVSTEKEHTLESCLAYIHNSAKMYSDGQTVKLHIGFDIFNKDNEEPHLYHYYITDRGRGRQEGVIIPRNRDGVFEFQLH